MRERPVAARSRNTPESMSCAPAVAPTIAPTRNAISDMNWRLSVKPFSPPAGGFFSGLRAVLDGDHDEREQQDAERQPGADGEHAAPAAQLEHVGC